MATKIIKALIDGVVQDIEVEVTTSPEQPLSYDERIDTLEDKHEIVITDGNFLVGNGTTELEEITPEDALSHIGGASVVTMTTAEFEAMEENDFNANTLYMTTDGESDYYTKEELDEMGLITINLEGSTAASPNPINADTLGGHTIDSLVDLVASMLDNSTSIEETTPEDIVAWMCEDGAIVPMAASNGAVYTTNDNKILIL